MKATSVGDSGSLLYDIFHTVGGSGLFNPDFSLQDTVGGKFLHFPPVYPKKEVPFWVKKGKGSSFQINCDTKLLRTKNDFFLVLGIIPVRINLLIYDSRLFSGVTHNMMYPPVFMHFYYY